MAPARLRLRCRGVVQGVGFRPAVHRLASALGLRGTIENCGGEVLLDLWGPRSTLQQVLLRLPAALPAQAQLEPLQPEWLAASGDGPQQLHLGASGATPLAAGWVAAGLVPDLAPCSACLAELRDPANRRYRHPFISCSSCGPRASIATAEPYCRAHTTLAGFDLCPACRREFEDPGDRRFHAETIGCPACGPRLHWHPLTSSNPGDAAPLAAALARLRAGGIVALQGVGGFQLLVDATNADAVARLRRRKRRPAKPLALLVAALDQLEPWLVISAAERAALTAPAAPIVLLARRQPAAGTPLGEGLAPGSMELGVMLPASPLHQLLAEDFGRPLVATSGNLSGEPMLHDGAEALQRLGDPAAPIADGVLLHNRPIARPLDDSVLRCIEGRPVLLRRARGYAPSPLPRPAGPPHDGAVLALGGDLRSAPALALGERIWVAPQLGDLDDGRCHDQWQAGLAELLARHGDQVTTICSDQHPGYRSVQWARECCRGTTRWRHLAVQHHQAHGLAVLAEHGRRPPALVLAFDGLGYGTGAVPLWGGEGLVIGADGRCQRRISLRPLPLIGGDRAALEPRRVALGVLATLGASALGHAGAAAVAAAFADAERQLLLQALAADCQSPRSSSMGRLFDAAASLLDRVQVLSYEGQGGLVLQGAAEAVLAAGGDPKAIAYPLPLVPAPNPAAVPLWWDWQPLVLALLADRAAGVEPAVGALRFHRAVIAASLSWAVAAAATSPAPVVLCGGCFQNRLLLDGTISALRQAGLEPLWAQQLPSGDGGLALGQILAAQLQVHNSGSSAAGAFGAGAAA